MVWFTKRRKRQLARSACTNHAAKAFLKEIFRAKSGFVHGGHFVLCIPTKKQAVMDASQIFCLDRDGGGVL